ncbi:MAG: R3H domain-containing nucleic acid-binding protein [Parcubacteria group bacterium]
MKEKNPNDIKIIVRQVVMELVEKMKIDCETEIKEFSQDGKDNLVCNIKTEESSYLIGQYGINLQALQHLARVIVRKKTTEKADFILDVNLYRQEKNESTAVLARNMAEKAVMEKKAVILRPMSPYERRLVHMELSGNEKVKTESIGEGEERQVIIKPL